MLPGDGRWKNLHQNFKDWRSLGRRGGGWRRGRTAGEKWERSEDVQVLLCRAQRILSKVALNVSHSSFCFGNFFWMLWLLVVSVISLPWTAVYFLLPKDFRKCFYFGIFSILPLVCTYSLLLLVTFTSFLCWHFTSSFHFQVVFWSGSAGILTCPKKCKTFPEWPVFQVLCCPPWRFWHWTAELGGCWGLPGQGTSWPKGGGA